MIVLLFALGTAVMVDNGNIGQAATDRAMNPATAATTYGPIADWDSKTVSKMKFLFNNKGSFNDDISKWNVAAVSHMESTPCEHSLKATPCECTEYPM